MSTTYFHLQEHEVPTCHIREYPGATSGSQEEILHLNVKQYTPIETATSPPPNSMTIIAAHACGFAKELYEPLWDEIYKRSRAQGFSIRSIWIADIAHMGLSSILNEGKLSNDPSWMDHSRDLLLMINQFRHQMPRPIVGLGHSFGGSQITNLAYMHPRLFTTILLLDPVIQLGPPPLGLGKDPPGNVNMSTYRRDLWPSRQAAAEAYAKTPVFAAWDKRVFERQVAYGFRDLPTAVYPDLPKDSDPDSPPVTLTTTRHQEVWTYVRPNYENYERIQAGQESMINRSTHADMDPDAAFLPFYRGEPLIIFKRIPTVRPSALWLMGGKSNLNRAELQQAAKACGTGVDGSGGMAEGRVKAVILPEHGHLFPMENVDGTAHECAQWLGAEMARWREAEVEWQAMRAKRSREDDLKTDERWRKIIKPLSAFREPKGKPSKL